MACCWHWQRRCGPRLKDHRHTHKGASGVESGAGDATPGSHAARVYTCRWTADGLPAAFSLLTASLPPTPRAPPRPPQDDFKRLYPTNPDHYIKICKKAYSALGKNNFKVSEKTM